MDRQIVYPGAIPLDTDLLNLQRDVLVAVGYLAQATLGMTTVADGLACLPTAPPSMSVAVGPGSVTQFGVVDSQSYGTLPAASQPLVRMGINLSATEFLLGAPTTPGYSINFLIEATLLESDANSIVLPYYNAANPAQPFGGPNNSGAAQNTQRLQSVQLQLKAGAANATGTQQTPPVDSGWVGLYVVTVAYGQSAISGGNIEVLPTAPFLAWKLPQLTPGTHAQYAFTPANQGSWTVPPGVTNVKLRLWGGGGAGGAGFGGAGGGGAGGGYVEGFCPVSPGQNIAVVVGSGGVGSGTAGGNSSFGSLASATGGQAGGDGASGAAGVGGATGGIGHGLGFAASGQSGAPALEAGSTWISGGGGGAFSGVGAEPVAATTGTAAQGRDATLPGGGGSGGTGSGVGGQGGAGLVLVEW